MADNSSQSNLVSVRFPSFLAHRKKGNKNKRIKIQKYGSEKQSSSQDQETRQSLVNISENQPQLKNRVVDGLIDSWTDRQTGIKRIRSKNTTISAIANRNRLIRNELTRYKIRIGRRMDRFCHLASDFGGFQ